MKNTEPTGRLDDPEIAEAFRIYRECVNDPLRFIKEIHAQLDIFDSRVNFLWRTFEVLRREKAFA